MTPQPKQGEADEPENDAKSPKPKSEGEFADLEAASDRIRETAKWLVATFGAVAGALIVGLQLSDIGQLEGSDRVIAAIAAFAALAAVILIVALASVVLARGRVPLGELASSKRSRRYRRLRAALNRQPSLYGHYGSAGALVDRVESVWDKQFRSWEIKQDRSKSNDEREQATREFEETKEVMPELIMLTKRLMAFARAEDIRLTFEWVRNTIIALAIIVAVGGAIFAYVDNAPSDAEKPAVAQRPVAASLSLTASGKQKMGTILGSGCDLEQVPIEVLSSTKGGWEAVSIPARGCDAAHLAIEPEDGELQALEKVSLEPGELEPPPG